MFEPTMLAWHNGQIVERESAAPSIASHSLHLGIGVFDGMMAYWNGHSHNILEGDRHLERFRNGTNGMDLRFPWSHEDLCKGIYELLSHHPGEDLYIRPIAYRPAPQINVTGIDEMQTDVAIFGVHVPPAGQKAIACHISPIQRISGAAMPVHWKICGAYVNSYLVRREAEKAGFMEGIMLDRHGNIAEASAANVYFMEGDHLVTPEITPDIFPGITRTIIAGIAGRLGVDVQSRTISPDQLDGFSGAFLCASLMEIAPISRIGELAFATQTMPLFQAIRNEFEQLKRR